ncbi:6-hydroxymethylpterin diphosphokinase MptE-like protein [Neptuniibacter sp.]|uniref:6-hydroxymethylpterin diphosphokinase MptE-like protein n=1 Tax=Neptuniibacter sp. TaxID=1962643 RepID=UPI002633A973|nr:6-hydroxymethylpterin diphosphokinase MptE-like protein [Neptuniibacter sp.]MCP4597066.1 DUF115 domain-containing protein [Neptuniibacter sp.]
MVEYAERHEGWMGYAKLAAEATGEHGSALWEENTRINRKLFRESGKRWAAELEDAHKGKTCVMIGASPALANQLDELRELQHDKDFVLFAISCNVKYLLDSGIKPDYVITVDPHHSQGDFFDGLDMALTKDITLIANVFAYPQMLEIWQGPLRWLALASDIEPWMTRLQKWYRPVNGIGKLFPALSSQYNIGIAIAILIFGCGVIIFVGNELSYKDKKTTYYVDRTDEKDEYKREPAVDIYGGVVYTSRMLFTLKIVSEWFIGQMAEAAWFFNCTEAGIFGVSKSGNEPNIWQLTLKNGVAQAKQIMRAGQPFLSETRSIDVVHPNRTARLGDIVYD